MLIPCASTLLILCAGCGAAAHLLGKWRPFCKIYQKITNHYLKCQHREIMVVTHENMPSYCYTFLANYKAFLYNYKAVLYNYKGKYTNRDHSQKMDLNGKYNAKLDVIPKPWNDPTVPAVILVVTFCCKHTRKVNKSRKPRFPTFCSKSFFAWTRSSRELRTIRKGQIAFQSKLRLMRYLWDPNECNCVCFLVYVRTPDQPKNRPNIIEI